MKTLRKNSRIALFAILGFFCPLSGAKAADIELLVDWGTAFFAKSSTGTTLSTGTATLQLGWFNSVPTDWGTINRSNLSSSFKSIAQLSYVGGGEYSFEGDYTAVDTTYTYDSDGETVLETFDNSAALNRAFLVMTSGSDQLGIFSWALPDGTEFNMPRDPQIYPTAITSIDTTVGDAGGFMFNMEAQVGSVTSSGVQLASRSVTPVSETSTQFITFEAIPSKSVGDSFVLAATASSGLTVSYSSSNPSLATVAGNRVTIVGTGSVVITASQAGNTSYSAAPGVAQPITTFASTGLRVSSLGTPLLNGNQTEVTHTFVGNPNATYTIGYKSDLSVATWTTITAQTGVTGTFTATFTTSGDYVNAWKNRMFFRANNS